MNSEHALEMFVAGLLLDRTTQAPVVLLKDEKGLISLPIWIGLAEATSIASALNQIEMTRPLTHDLLVSSLQAVGAVVERIIITELREATYFAELVISVGERVSVLDCRPSDAIAVAIRCHAPIFVALPVIESAKNADLRGVPLNEAKKGSEGDNLPEQSKGAEKAAPVGEASPEESEENANFAQIDREKWDEILEDLDPDDFKYKM